MNKEEEQINKLKKDITVLRVSNTINEFQFRQEIKDLRMSFNVAIFFLGVSLFLSVLSLIIR